MNHRIIGTTLPVLEFQLQPGESVVAVSGELSWMSHSIQLKTGAQHGGGGFLGAFKRVAGGGSLFMTEYSAQGDQGYWPLLPGFRVIFYRSKFNPVRFTWFIVTASYARPRELT